MNSGNLWAQVLNVLERNVPRESFLTWFAPLKFLSQENGVLKIGVPNRFFHEFLETHYRKQISAALASVSPDQLRITYEVVHPGAVESAASPEAAPPVQHPWIRENGFDKRTQLNPRYTFANFVEGDSNSFAKASSFAVAEAPGRTSFNPLFVYGTSGLGKTHLIQALGNYALQHHRQMRTLYVSCEKFINDFIHSIKAYKTTDFSRFYRSVDILLLDDVQFLRGKERTQMEFFHTFNSLYQTGKQIVLSSDRPPKDFDDFDRRLTSRIGCGLVVDIQPPDYETRLAILEHRAETDNIPLQQDVAEFLANEITDNIRDLESALIRLMAHSSITGKDITLPLAKTLLKDHIRTVTAPLSIEQILQKVAAHFNLPAELLVARNRTKNVAWARQIAMFLCTELTAIPLQNIGRQLGNRDHSTVIYARNLISKEINKNQNLAEEIKLLKKNINSH